MSEKEMQRFRHYESLMKKSRKAAGGEKPPSCAIRYARLKTAVRRTKTHNAVSSPDKMFIRCYGRTDIRP